MSAISNPATQCNKPDQNPFNVMSATLLFM